MLDETVMRSSSKGRVVEDMGHRVPFALSLSIRNFSKFFQLSSLKARSYIYLNMLGFRLNRMRRNIIICSNAASE